MSGPKPGPSETRLFIKAETNIDAFSTGAVTAYFTVLNWFSLSKYSVQFPRPGSNSQRTEIYDPCLGIQEAYCFSKCLNLESVAQLYMLISRMRWKVTEKRTRSQDITDSFTPQAPKYTRETFFRSHSLMSTWCFHAATDQRRLHFTVIGLVLVSLLQMALSKLRRLYVGTMNSIFELR